MSNKNKKLLDRDRIDAILSQIKQGVCESKLDGKVLNYIIYNHPSEYLQAVTVRG